MFGFLQGFAYGLFLSCPVWLVIGLVDPRRAVPAEPARRWQVLVRYILICPFIAFLIWLTSLFGGFGPSVAGWTAGLLAIAVAVPAERRLRRLWQHYDQRRQQARRTAAEAERRAQRERAARESGTAQLDPQSPPADADEVVTALCRSKASLIELQRSTLAAEADRIYNRYCHGMAVLRSKFNPQEITFERSRSLIVEVCWSAIDRLDTMASLARGVAGIDIAYVRQRLTADGPQLGDEERRALERRLELAQQTDARLRALAAENESTITALDDAVVALSGVNTQRPRASVAADQALADLHRFANQAQRYAHGEAER